MRAPSFHTAATRRMLPMSVSGSAREDQQVGALAGLDRARTRRGRARRAAPLRVAATSACDGVMPSSTSPSMAMIVPMPWSCSGNFGVRVQLGRRGPVAVGARRHAAAGANQLLCVLPPHLEIRADLGGFLALFRRSFSRAPALGLPSPASARFFSTSSLVLRCRFHAGPVIVLASIEQHKPRSRIGGDEVVRHLAAVEQLGCWMPSMPAAIDTPEAFDARANAFRRRVCACAPRSTITCCASAEKPMKVGSEKWLVPPNFEEIRSLVEIGVDRARGARPAVIAISSSPPPCAMKSFICSWNKRQLSHDAAERERVAARSSRGCCPRRESARRTRRRARSRRAPSTSGTKRAVTVANRRDAVAQIDLGGLEDDLRPAVADSERATRSGRSGRRRATGGRWCRSDPGGSTGRGRRSAGRPRGPRRGHEGRPR